MNLSFIEKLDINTQECAYDLYIELDKLQQDLSIDLPPTLLSHIAILLEKYNNVLSDNSDLNTKLRNSNDLLKKEIQKRIFFEENLKKEKITNDQLTNDADEQLRQHDKKEREQAEQIKQLKSKITALNDEVSQLKMTRIPQNNDTRNQETSKKKLIIPESSTPGSSSFITPNNEHIGTSVEPEPQHAPATSDPTTPTDSPKPANLNEPMGTAPSTTHTPAPTPKTSFNPNQNSSSPPKINNIFLVGDSHTKDLKPMMISKLPEKCYIRSFVKPGKNIKYLVDNIKPHLIIPGTQIIFFAGTNDVFRTPWSNIKSSLDKLQKKLKDFQVLFILIPPRYDVRKINNHIAKLNPPQKRLEINFVPRLLFTS
ncbi:hypothetical protein M8J77_022767 [Diaphorina citri]|nr:hypothetical protein M8J77_022767 [Diaphorina citri]